MESLKLGIQPLSLAEIHEVAVGGRAVELSKSAKQRIEKAHTFLLSQIKGKPNAKANAGKTLYGVNTGFGLLSNVRIPDQDLEALQYNLLRSHACGVGPYLEDRFVRAMLLLRAYTLSLGHSGVSLKLIESILDLLNEGVIPLIPEQGSVGASGDLAPLAHLALVLIGEGQARVRGKEVSGKDSLRSAGLEPIRLGPKEGLALINGTQFMTAIGVLSLIEAEELCDLADLAGSMSLEAVRGTTAAFEPEIHAVRPHPGQTLVAGNLRKILTYRDKKSPQKSEIAKDHENCGKVQDPYSFRCMPQVHGASRDTLSFVRQVLEREANSVTDNPLVFPSSEKILSGGNFHGQIVAIAMDALAIAVSELGSISEQRISKLMNPAFSELPPFLTSKGGLNSGFMMVQVTAASLVSENKTLCHPASVDSIPTSADKEDHVSMGAWAARKAAKVIVNTRRVLCQELLAGAQGIDMRRPLRSSEFIEKAHQLIRKKVKPLEDDRVFYKDFAAVEECIGSIAFKNMMKEFWR